MTALELADRLASGWPALEDVNAAVRELRRLAELERDAARYRWMVANLEHDGFGYWLPELCVKEGKARPQKDQCDAAIDAAMGEAK